MVRKADTTKPTTLRRRSLWLIVIGLAHATLLMAGDIIGYYGVLSLALGALFLGRTDRTLNWWILIGAALLVYTAAKPVVSALLRGTALVGIAVGQLGALPAALAHVGML